MAAHTRGIRRLPWLPALLLAVFLAECLFCVFFAEINYDDGWYLLASRLVYCRQLPYLDFAYLQAPLLPYVYGLWQQIFGHGLVAGRVLSMLFSVAGAALAAHAAHRQAGPGASVLTLLGYVTSTTAILILTRVTNIALSTMLAVLGAWLFLGAPRDGRRNVLAATALALATAVRVSFGAAAGVLLLSMLIVHRARLRRALAPFAAAGCVSALCWGPSLLLAPQQMWFNIFASQLGRSQQAVGQPVPLPLPSLLFVSCSLFAVAVGAFVLAAGAAAATAKHTRAPGPAWPAISFLVAMALVAYVPNLLTGDPYPHYLVMGLPFLAIATGILAVALYPRLGRLARTAVLALLILFVAYGLISSALYLSMTSSLARPQLRQLQDVAHRVAAAVPAGQPLFAFETQLAVEADRPVVHGLEMSIFSYFPRLSDADARHYHVVNDHLIAETLASGAPGAVILTETDIVMLRDRGGQSKGPRIPRTEEELIELFPELRGRYWLAETVSGYGRWDTNLYILIPPIR